jgi:hypothetical protein
MTIDCYKTHVLTTRTDTFTPPSFPLDRYQNWIELRNRYLQTAATFTKGGCIVTNFGTTISEMRCPSVSNTSPQEPIRITNNVSSRIQANAPSTSPRRYMLEECRSPMARDPQGQGGNDSHFECRNNNFLRNVSASIS